MSAWTFSVCPHPQGAPPPSHEGFRPPGWAYRSQREQWPVEGGSAVLYDASLIIPVFSDGTHTLRYLGVLDLDADLEERPLFFHGNDEEWAALAAAKRTEALCLFIKESGERRAVEEGCAAMRVVREQTEAIVDGLRARNVPHLTYFTGGKGYRVLVRAPPWDRCGSSATSKSGRPAVSLTYDI